MLLLETTQVILQRKLSNYDMAVFRILFGGRQKFFRRSPNIFFFWPNDNWLPYNRHSEFDMIKSTIGAGTLMINLSFYWKSKSVLLINAIFNINKKQAGLYQDNTIGHFDDKSVL